MIEDWQVGEWWDGLSWVERVRRLNLLLDEREWLVPWVHEDIGLPYEVHRHNRYAQQDIWDCYSQREQA